MTRTATPPPADPVAATLDHLHAAAEAAAANAAGHLFSPWAALASQIRLTAESIDPTCFDPTSAPQLSESTPAPRPETAIVGNSLRRAAEALDQALPTPEALQWIWQVHQLRRLAAQLAAQPSVPA